VEEGGAGGGGRPDLAVSELELPRAPWKPALLRQDADAVYPEDRSASAAMDAFNADHHLFSRMPEQWSVLLPLPRAEPPPFCSTVLPAVHRSSQTPR
jgi:hypothetical protein